jgi:siderophore synthetase component
MTSIATGSPARTADDVTAHTMLNCLIREVSGPEHQVTVDHGQLLLRLPRRGVLLRIAVARVSLIGAHRFTGPVQRLDGTGWTETGWRELAGYIRDELELRSGVTNEEFLDQVADSRETIHTILAHRAEPEPDLDYVESEQSLIFGHRFHPAPKARSGDPEDWLAHGPETRTRCRLRYLAVPRELIVEEGDVSALDALCPGGDPGVALLPAHPWQYRLLRAAVPAGGITDLGIGGPEFAPTASVRTLYQPDADTFLKFSLNVRITNCVRRSAAYELSGAVALTRLLRPLFTMIGSTVLAEPGYRSLGIAGDTALLEGLGVIVRSGLRPHLRPGVTALLAAAVADEHSARPAHVSRLLERGEGDALAWWDAYLGLLLPPVLTMYFEHGVVLEPHLQNVLVGVTPDGMPAQMLFRDLEGTKLLPEHHGAFLAGLPGDVSGPITYDAERGWNRIAYCLLVNHTAEVLAALADGDPALEPALWALVRDHLDRMYWQLGGPPRLRALLSGVPLPAKANLLLRWSRHADRHAGYVPLPSPFGADFTSAVTR